MSSDVTKRAVSAGFGVGALALLARRASADTPFSSFAFPATGAPTARTLPDRLAEIKNVKDFGAKGDGVANDAPAIQAAVNSIWQMPSWWPTATAYSGVIYFPPGIYKLQAPIIVRKDIVVNADEFNVHFLGSGLSSILYNQTGGHFCIERTDTGIGGNAGLCTIEKLNFFGDGIAFNTVSNVRVRDCLFSGERGVWSWYGVWPAGILIEDCAFRGDYNNPRSIAIYGMAHVVNCSVFGCYAGFIGSGAVRGGDWEVNRIAIQIGGNVFWASSLPAGFLPSTPNGIGSTMVIDGVGFEGNGIGVYAVDATYSKISACTFQGHDASPAPPPGIFGPPAIPSPSGANFGNRSAIAVQNCSASVIEAISTGGWYSGPIIDLREPAHHVVIMSAISHADETSPVLWSPNPGGYTFIACNQP